MDNYKNLITIPERLQLVKANWNCGIKYSFSNDLDDEEAFKLVNEFINLAKTKNLTIRQAQQIFLVCSDYILENELK